MTVKAAGEREWFKTLQCKFHDVTFANDADDVYGTLTNLKNINGMCSFNDTYSMQKD